MAVSRLHNSERGFDRNWFVVLWAATACKAIGNVNGDVDGGATRLLRDASS